MGTTNINIRTDAAIKAQAEAIFEAFGLNMSTAINMFLRQTIREQGIPFELRLDIPNADTTEAIREGKRIAYDASIRGYSSLEELKAALDL